ncbi:MAG: UDP-2,4-diacetamido-2,4,6-trideoxy-beta-L-altropyranose hydrolase, partial [Steroidobacteraceae bacterium]
MIPAERAHVSPSEPSRVAIRVDASAAIGYGHLTRCLALALALRDSGAEPTFLCARLPPELQHDIEQQGFPLVQLPRTTSDADHQSHPFLLDQDADSDAVARALGEEKQQFDSVVVDHYGIDAIWERRMRQWASVTAITDRADRMHDVDVLLDQNLQDRSNRYDGLVPANCQLLLGPRFALLRPEFAARRAGLARAHGQHSV